MIYFLRYEVDDCPVKIGYTEDRDRLQARMRNYATHSPWPIEGLALIDGGRALERELHAILAQWRMRAEWFSPAEPVLRLAAWCRNNPAASRGEVIEKASTLAGVPAPGSGLDGPETQFVRAHGGAFARTVRSGSATSPRTRRQQRRGRAR